MKSARAHAEFIERLRKFVSQDGPFHQRDKYPFRKIAMFGDNPRAYFDPRDEPDVRMMATVDCPTVRLDEVTVMGVRCQAITYQDILLAVIPL